jgi:hypothetical protein
MSTAAQAISAYVLKDLVRKLNPARFPTIADLGCAHWFCARDEVLPSLHQGGRSDHRWDRARPANGDMSVGRVLGSHSDILRSWMHVISKAGQITRIHGSSIVVCREDWVPWFNKRMSRGLTWIYKKSAGEHVAFIGTGRRNALRNLGRLQ